MAKIRVLIVDDSIVFRSQIKAALEGEPAIEVVGVAPNGKIALEKLKAGDIDLVTLDLEMPEMDGLTTISEMKKLGIKTKVIVFSSLTQKRADAALKALTNGACDVVAKPTGSSGSLEAALLQVKSDLVPKIKQFIPGTQTTPTPNPVPVAPKSVTVSPTPVSSPSNFPKVSFEILKPQAIVIGSSTGGPDALEKIFDGLGSAARCPIFIAQHMPPVFTASLAKRITAISQVECLEAKHGEAVVANRIYIAPGDFHMTLEKKPQGVFIKLDQGPKIQSVRPAVDPLFQTASAIYGQRLAGIILTGMGEDGLRGSQAIKAGGGGILIQNAETCIVFGMPGAIFRAGIYDRMGDLETIRSILGQMARLSGLTPKPLAA